MARFLEFERPIAELESKIEGLRHLSSQDSVNISAEISKLQQKSNRLLAQVYKALTPWQRVQVARHQDRPQFFDYLNVLFTDFQELSGDRYFKEDKAIIGGLAHFGSQSVMVIGQQKGKDIDDRIRHNFGLAMPEGYRKARRLMELAHRFSLPVLTFVDTIGAYPVVEAEERGQAEAIAKCTEACLSIEVPLISVIIGEGGSGGAVAIAASNVVLMLEHAVYSVITPEACASILWKTAEKAPDAAEALKITSKDLLKLKVIDQIIKEPLGGAHRNPRESIDSVREALTHHLDQLSVFSGESLKTMRRERFLKIGNKDLLL